MITKIYYYSYQTIIFINKEIIAFFKTRHVLNHLLTVISISKIKPLNSLRHTLV